MHNVHIYVDGSCTPNGNAGMVGGWAAIMLCGDHEKILSGHEAATTTHRVELTAIIEGLRALTKPCEVTIHTRNAYISEAPSRVRSWIGAGWKTKGGSVPKNLDLWHQLIAAGNAGKHKITFVVDAKPDPAASKANNLAKEQKQFALGLQPTGV